jgi:hypothetical protein
VNLLNEKETRDLEQERMSKCWREWRDDALLGVLHTAGSITPKHTGNAELWSKPTLISDSTPTWISENAMLKWKWPETLSIAHNIATYQSALFHYNMKPVALWPSRGESRVVLSPQLWVASKYKICNLIHSHMKCIYVYICSVKFRY